MKLFDLLFGKDPTWDWPAAPSVGVIEYDFDRKTLCGVSLGSPVDAFRRLGKPSDRADAKKGFFRYYDRGMQIEVEQGHVLDCSFFWSTDWTSTSEPLKPFNGRFRARGAELRWTPQTTEAEIVAILGPPSKRTSDEESIQLHYDNADVSYAFDLTEKGLLRQLIVTAEEVMKRGG